MVIWKDQPLEMGVMGTDKRTHLGMTSSVDSSRSFSR